MSLVLLPRQIIVDQNGKPRVGAKLYTYDATTTNPRVSYTTLDYNIPHPNPVPSVANGLFPAIYVNPTGGNYKIVITDSAGVEIYSEDKIPVRDHDFDGQSIGTALYPLTIAEQNASITPTNFAYPPDDVRRYGGTGDGVTNDRSAINQAQSIGGRVYFPRGTYRVASNLTLSNVTLVLDQGAIIKRDSGVTVTWSNVYIDAGPWQIFDDSASGLFTGTFRNPHLYYEWWGALGDGDGAGGGTNDALAIQKTFKAAVDSNFLAIRPRACIYKCDTTIHVGGDATGNIYMPKLVGPDMDKCIFDFSNVGAAGCFVIKSPTSGHPLHCDVICGIRIKGSGTSWAVEFNGVCGAYVTHCSFYGHAEAARFHNEAVASFTEYCMLKDCYFGVDTGLLCHYMKTSGDSSFHGSGLSTRVIEGSNSARTFIQIDAGCQPYNAQFDAQIFATAAACTLIQNNSGLSVTFTGRLTWESGVQVLTLGAGGEVLFAGSLCGTGENATGGTFTQCDSAILNTDNSTTALGARKGYSKVMAAGANTLTSNFPSHHRWLRVEFVATGYHYEYTGTVAPIAGTTGLYTNTLIDNTNGGIAAGAPTFSVNSAGNLIATNASWNSTVTAYWHERALADGVGGKRQTI